ncbi:hypothetical protein DSCA_11860 [Desulfosarcina alkanivorans]|uniref:Uncharacterized protein n=1 Tax=Desulfosarcina alkanivorans TaxID=571177 RepID=A0A5K7YE20_9BACT|nr:hypothetical protein DSCA_11860 [Desulfosarcina alkanivorans]
MGTVLIFETDICYMAIFNIEINTTNVIKSLHPVIDPESCMLFGIQQTVNSI